MKALQKNEKSDQYRANSKNTSGNQSNINNNPHLNLQFSSPFFKSKKLQSTTNSKANQISLLQESTLMAAQKQSSRAAALQRSNQSKKEQSPKSLIAKKVNEACTKQGIGKTRTSQSNLRGSYKQQSSSTKHLAAMNGSSSKSRLFSQNQASMNNNHSTRFSDLVDFQQQEQTPSNNYNKQQKLAYLNSCSSEKSLAGPKAKAGLTLQFSANSKSGEQCRKQRSSSSSISSQRNYNDEKFLRKSSIKNCLLMNRTDEKDVNNFYQMKESVSQLKHLMLDDSIAMPAKLNLQDDLDQSDAFPATKPSKELQKPQDKSLNANKQKNHGLKVETKIVTRKEDSSCHITNQFSPQTAYVRQLRTKRSTMNLHQAMVQGYGSTRRANGPATATLNIDSFRQLIEQSAANNSQSNQSNPYMTVQGVNIGKKSINQLQVHHQNINPKKSTYDIGLLNSDNYQSSNTQQTQNANGRHQGPFITRKKSQAALDQLNVVNSNNKKVQEKLEKVQNKAAERKREIIQLKEENLKLRSLVNYLLQIKLSNGQGE